MESLDREDIPAFSVVLVFEDLDTGKRAKRAHDFLVENLTHEWQVTSQMWKFGLLSIPELREIAARDAATANLIIISSRGDRELPADVKTWIEMWQGSKGEPLALVAIFDRPPEQAPHAQATLAYLEGVAQREHMEFFAWPEAVLALQIPQEMVVLEGLSGMDEVPFLPAVMTPPEVGLAHWGINE